MTIWFTGDQHYHHKMMIVHCDRPFRNIDIMNNQLIANHNSVVEENDIVYHLGDFVFPTNQNPNKVTAILNRLKGHHHLILGNHDELKPFSYVNSGFLSVHTVLSLDEMMIWLAHDPSIFCVMPEFYWLLCVHVHTLFHIQNRCINVGVDMNAFAPVSWETVQTIIKREEKDNVN